MPKVLKIQPGDPSDMQYLFECPGCGNSHGFRTEGAGPPLWQFNGDLDKPTIRPSLLIQTPSPRGLVVCHSFITSGTIQFLNDCSHALAGQTVELPEIN